MLEDQEVQHRLGRRALATATAVLGMVPPKRFTAFSQPKFATKIVLADCRYPSRVGLKPKSVRPCRFPAPRPRNPSALDLRILPGKSSQEPVREMQEFGFSRICSRHR
jgi:hypothetical protein